jgi:hypothetical protein
VELIRREILARHAEGSEVKAVMIDFFLYVLAKEREAAGECTVSSTCQVVVSRSVECRESGGHLGFFPLSSGSEGANAVERARNDDLLGGATLGADSETGLSADPHHRTRSIWY